MHAVLVVVVVEENPAANNYSDCHSQHLTRRLQRAQIHPPVSAAAEAPPAAAADHRPKAQTSKGKNVESSHSKKNLIKRVVGTT